MRFRRRNIQRKHCKAAAAEPYRKKSQRTNQDFQRQPQPLLSKFQIEQISHKVQKQNKQFFYRGKIELFEKHDWSWSNIFKDKKNLRVISLLSIFSSMNITVWTAETTIHLAFVTTKLCLYDRWQCISLEIKKIEELLRRNLALGTSY